MSEWKWKTLGGIASSEGYGLVDGPFGSNLPASCYVESGIPVIRGSNLTLGTERFVADEFVYVSEETASRLERSLARPNDIVFTKKGTIGQTGLVPTDLPYEVYLISSNQMKLTVDESLADPIFVYYYVSSEASKNKIRKDSEFTGVPKTNTKYLREFPIYLPPLQKQHQIANILDSLDRKIENLRKQNETLEAIAQTLFKHWFVDFEFPNEDGKPYKSSGGAMERSELGEIPAGWHLGKLGEEVDTLGGGTPSTTTSEYWENGDIPWYSPTDLTRSKTLFSLGSEKKITKLGLEKSSARLFPKYSLLLTSRATLGEITINTQDACTNQGFITIIPNERFSVYFLYGWLLTQINLIKQLASGSTFPELSKSTFRNFSFLIPDSVLLTKYNHVIKPLFQKIENNIRQIQSLTKTRDVLLPKLMSGQIKVRG